MRQDLPRQRAGQACAPHPRSVDTFALGADLKPKEPVDLDDERTVHDVGQSARERVALLVVDDEQLAAGPYSQRRLAFVDTLLLLELYCTSALTNDRDDIA